LKINYDFINILKNLETETNFKLKINYDFINILDKGTKPDNFEIFENDLKKKQM
jgi:hypothetical protein